MPSLIRIRCHRCCTASGTASPPSTRLPTRWPALLTPTSSMQHSRCWAGARHGPPPLALIMLSNAPISCSLAVIITRILAVHMQFSAGKWSSACCTAMDCSMLRSCVYHPILHLGSAISQSLRMPIFMNCGALGCCGCGVLDTTRSATSSHHSADIHLCSTTSGKLARILPHSRLCQSQICIIFHHVAFPLGTLTSAARIGMPPTTSSQLPTPTPTSIKHPESASNTASIACRRLQHGKCSRNCEGCKMPSGWCPPCSAPSRRSS